MAETVSHKAFIGHVNELRSRLSWSALVFIVAGTLAYFVRKPLINLIAKPLNQPLYYSAPSGSFEFVMRVCVAAGVVLALPVIVYNIIRFVEPAFEKERIGRTRIALIILASFALTWLGIWFSFVRVLPMSFKFFAEFAFGPIKPLISTNDYFSFVIGSVVTFALIFQLPLLLLTFNTMNRFPPGGLRKYRKHVIVGSLALALVLPFTYDPITQFVVALPIIMLYEVSILSVWLVNRRSYKLQTQPAHSQRVKSSEKSKVHTKQSQPAMFVPSEKAAHLGQPSPQFAHHRPIQMG